MAAATAVAANSAAPSSSSSQHEGDRQIHEEQRRRRERQLSGQHGSLRRYKGDEAGSETDSIESIYKQLSAPRKVSAFFLQAFRALHVQVYLFI